MAARRRPFSAAGTASSGICAVPKAIYLCLLAMVGLLVTGNTMLYQSRQCENTVTVLKQDLESRKIALQEAESRIGALEGLLAKKAGGRRDEAPPRGAGAAAWRDGSDIAEAVRRPVQRGRGDGDSKAARGRGRAAREEDHSEEEAAGGEEERLRRGGAAAAAPAAAAPVGAAAPPAAAMGFEPAPQSPRSARAVIVFCYNRPDYLRRTLDSLLNNLPSYNRPHVYVSQDGSVGEVTAVIQEYGKKFLVAASDVPFTHLSHPPIANPNQGGHMAGYYKLAQHFGWGLNKLFGEAGHPRVIILEDDLEIAPDFFDYFTAVEPLLDSDSSLLAASAWSDLGQSVYASDTRAVYRSDFFPGLGWMLTSHAWEELGPKWPDSFWDDWLREPQQRKGRAFLRPEVSRSYTFGANGVSQAQFFAQYLENIHLNTERVEWASEDLSYLDKAAFDREWTALIGGAQQVDINALLAQQCGPEGGAFKTVYDSFPVYESFASRFGFITDVKAGVPRTAYQGAVHVRHGGCRKFLVPAEFAAAA